MITRSKAPAGIAELVSREVRAAAGAFDPNGAAGDDGGGGAPAVSDPLAVYYLPMEHLHRGGTVADATRVGWRYLIGDGDAKSSVDVRDAGEPAHVTGITMGRTAEGLAAARTVAENAVGGRGPFEARILEFGRAGTGTLWLHSEQEDDRFFALDGTAAREVSENDVIGEAASKASLHMSAARMATAANTMAGSSGVASFGRPGPQDIGSADDAASRSGNGAHADDFGG